MDYVKEIERIQREQERAIREAQIRTEQAARAALAQAGGNPAAPAARSRRGNKPADAVDARSSAAKAGSPPAALGAAARVARAVLAVPMAIAFLFVVSGLLDTWDGYYLRPAQLLSAVVPLLIFIGLLRLRGRLADPAAWQREVAAPEAGQRTQRAIGRWVAIIVLLVIASAFLEDVFPTGLPVGEWLGWPAPQAPSGA